MVSCSTIWCVLLAIALPTKVLSSDSSSDRHNVMKIDFLCGNGVNRCESPTYPPSENSHTETMDVNRADSGANNIQSKSEIKKRVDGILRGEVEPVPGQYFDPESELHTKAVTNFENFVKSCDEKLLEGVKNPMESDLTKRINHVFRKTNSKLYNDIKRSTSLWKEKDGRLKSDYRFHRYIGNDVMIAMIYQEIGMKGLQSKFVLIPNVPGYNCRYYKKHLQRKYEFVYAFALPLGTDPHLTMTTFLQRFAEYKKVADNALAA